MAVALYDKLRFFKFFTTYDCFMSSLRNVLLTFGNCSDDLGQYLSTKATYKEFLQAGNKKLYRSAHQDEIARYEEAVQFLKRNSTDGTIPTMKNLRAEKEKLFSARAAQYESYTYFKDYYHELQTACRNVDMILESEHTQQHSRTQPKRSYEQSI